MHDVGTGTRIGVPQRVGVMSANFTVPGKWSDCWFVNVQDMWPVITGFTSPKAHPA